MLKFGKCVKGTVRYLASEKYVDLTSWRSLIALKGRDAESLLQGVTTNDLSNLIHVKSIYSMLLNSKGRVMFDIILYRMAPDEIFVECDHAISAKVKKHLSMYKIRRKVSIDILKDCPIGHIMNPKFELENHGLENQFYDPRFLEFGKRVIGNDDFHNSSTLDDYQRKRYQLGIPEGSEEIIFNKSFPLESNLDYLNGVSFHKGCYLGQELTARTFHTGVTRKRIVPIKIDKNNFEIEFRTQKNRKVGKVIKRDKDGFGLALFRIEHLNKPVNLGEETNIIISAPDWWNRQNHESLLFGIPDHFSHFDFQNFSEHY